MRTAFLAAALVSTPALAQETVGTWQFQVITDPMSDATRGIAHAGRGGEVFIVVKCDSNGDNSVYFSFISRQYIGSVRSAMRPVRYRIDGTPPRSIEAYYEGTSANVIRVAPDNDGGRFLRELSRATQLTVQVTNFRGEEYTSVIDVTGADQAIRRVATTCRDTVNSNLE